MTKHLSATAGAVDATGEAKKTAPTKESVSAIPEAVEAPRLVELQVWSIPPNPHLLICHRPEEDGSDPTRLVSVAVRSNSMFLKKMRLVARQVNDRHFNLEGPCPRWKGRW